MVRREEGEGLFERRTELVKMESLRRKRMEGVW